jgi:hypothetical protein
MKGNTLTDFIDDLLSMGGPEKEIGFRGRTYFIQSQPSEANQDLIDFVVFECFGDGNYIFRCTGKTNEECVEQFESAKIFDGMTIYEAESEIEVLYG